MAQIDFNRPISERNEVLNKTHANALPSERDGPQGGAEVSLIGEGKQAWRLALASHQAVNLLKHS